MTEGGRATQSASAEPLLNRLQGVQKSGDGWRAYCPSCDGRSRKLSIAQLDSRVLLHCFGGCRAEDVLSSTELSWADLMPPRHWPPSPEERRSARRAIQEAGWGAALSTLAIEATVVLLAARQLAGWQFLSEADDARLSQSVERLDGAANALLEPRTWRPAA
jgi:hypothetical protein